MSGQNPVPQPATHTLSAKDQFAAASAYARGESGKAGTVNCNTRISIGIFFDGTNNNRLRDEPTQGHSNVARLFNAFPDRPKEGKFGFYMPGVGTPFPEIGEMKESAEGKAFGAGGAARIHWALIQTLNAPNLAVHGSRLIENDPAKSAISEYRGLKDAWSLFNSKRQAWFRREVARLEAATKDHKPTVTCIDVAVFGFSRGAAMARAYVNWLLECCDNKGGKLTLAGMPLRITFLGIFDTVASVGVADSAPVPVKGHFDWADGTMRIPPEVDGCVHLVAAHEVRASFPLNCARDGKQYPANVLEVVYPGAHSDVGGGYGINTQGRSREGAAAMLSQLPLARMYAEARKAGVPLLPIKTDGQLYNDFEIDERLRQSFNTYLKHTAVNAGSVEQMLEAHMRYYRRYKAVTVEWELDALKSANPQDQQDLREAKADFKREVAALRAKEALSKLSSDPRIGPTAQLSERDKQLLEDLKTPVHREVIHFLDNYVHDAHAGFYLAGPVTDFDKKEEIKRVRAKAMAAMEGGESLNKWEKKVWDSVRTGKPFPVMTDDDQWDMLVGVQVVVKATTNTRRESTGYFRSRTVFDQS